MYSWKKTERKDQTGSECMLRCICAWVLYIVGTAGNSQAVADNPPTN